MTGARACGLAVLLGLPDGIWATIMHLAFIRATVIVAVTAAAGAATIGRARRRAMGINDHLIRPDLLPARPLPGVVGLSSREPNLIAA